LRGKVVFIYEATDLDMFRPTLSDPSPSDGYILSVGTYGRDFDSLVEAVKMLNMKTIIATKPECVAHLQPLPANVTAKLFDSKDMPALYAGARIVAVTLAPRGEYDSVGTLSLGEAYAMGKPTIVTKTESMESYVSDGVDAIFVPPRDPRTFLTTLEKVWNDEALRTKLGGNAARFAKNKLDSKHFASELAAFLQRVVG
jgi:glycosyltransferase involved in cell wall biosynthesis